MKVLTRIIFVLCAFSLISFVMYSNFALFGQKKVYKLSNNNQILLTPQNRIETSMLNNQQIVRQKDNLIYFEIPVGWHFETAKSYFFFKEPLPVDQIFLGYQDSEKWNFKTKILVDKNLPTINWNYIGENPRLYQRSPQYSSFDEFIADPPSDKIIGIHNYDANVLKNTPINNYQPSTVENVVNAIFRGQIVLYVFVQDEQFKMWISKQDLNWYEDPDVTSIRVYKDKEIVYSAVVDDDGITDASAKVGQPQEVFIQNPGPELPEPGIYKVVIDAGSDSIITQIKSTMHKMIFESPIYLASNAEIFPKIISQTQSNTLYTDALTISAYTPHILALQEIHIQPYQISADAEIKEDRIELTDINTEATFTATPSTSFNGLSEIFIPKSDVVLKAELGYFAFTPENYFSPSGFKLLPISKKDDLEKVDYLITNYKPTRQDGDWQVAEAEFDLSDAYIKNGKLSWIIKAPGLKERGGEVVIKDIQVELIKDPIIDPNILPGWLRNILKV